MAHGTVVIDRNIRFAAADIDQHTAEFLFVFRQDRFTGGNRFQNRVAGQQSASIDGCDDILCGGRGTGYDMHVNFEACSHHTERIAYAGLIIDGEFLGQDVDDLAIGRQGHGPGRLDDTSYVVAVDLARTCWDRSNAAAVEAFDMWTRETDVNRFDLAMSHRLGFGDAFLDRFNDSFQADDRTLLDSFGVGHSEPNGFQTRFQLVALRAPATRGCNQRAYLR